MELALSNSEGGKIIPFSILAHPELSPGESTCLMIIALTSLNARLFLHFRVVLKIGGPQNQVIKRIKIELKNIIFFNLLLVTFYQYNSFFMYGSVIK